MCVILRIGDAYGKCTTDDRESEFVVNICCKCTIMLHNIGL